MSLCRVRVGVWLAGGWGRGWVRGGSAGLCFGGLRAPLWQVGPLGVHGVALLGGLCRLLWGSWPLALGAVAAPSSSSGACEVALTVAGVVAWR